MAFLSEKLISASGPKEETDSDFNLVTALYHFDGSNGAQNDSFVDSSSESHTVTPGSTPPTQGSFSPFSADEGKWSVFFDGNGDYLQIADSSDLEIGSSEFTMECWFFQRVDSGSGSSSHTLLSKWDNDGRKEFILRITENSSNQVLQWLSSSDGSNNDANFYGNTVITNDGWHHAAATRDSSNTIRLFLDGVLQSSTASQSSTYTGTHEFMIGANGTSGIQQYMDGFISNVRFIKGTALYTGSSYTAPTAPLTAVTNTKLLTCCSNRYRDKSSSGHFIDRSGNVSIKPFSPFNPSEAYSASVKGGSAEFDQVGTTYLDITDSTDFDFGTEDFTVEAWVYPNKPLITSTVPFALMLNGSGGALSNFYFGWTTYSSKGLVIYGGANIGSEYSGSVDHVPKMGGWSHIVYQRTSGTFNFYLNGTRVYNSADSGAFPDVTGVRVGVSEHYGSYYMGAFLSDLRVVKGSNVYSNASTLTLPTTPLTAVTNTKLLLNFTNAAIIDQTGKTNIKTVGNARLNTSVKKFGTASVEFDGTDDYIEVPPSTSIFNVISPQRGSWTYECFIYPKTVVDAGGYGCIFDTRTNNPDSDGVSLFYVGTASQKRLECYGPAAGGYYFSTANNSITLDQWQHVALVFDLDATNYPITCYVNGTSVGSSTTNTWYTRDSGRLIIGAQQAGYNEFTGFIDEFRVTNKARYTSNFTAPTKEFPNL